MDLFENIDQFEEKLNEQIKDKVALFMRIMRDNEMLTNMLSGKNDEVSTDENANSIIEDIRKSQKVSDVIVDKAKAQGAYEEVKKKKKTKDFDTKIYGSGLQSAKFINYFGENSTNSKIFFDKNSEIDYIKNMIFDQMKDEIKKKFYIVYHESLQKPKMKIENTNDSIDKISPIDKSSSLNSKIAIRESIERLYPKPPVKENLLADEFFVKKINEYRERGELSKRIDIEELFKKMKLKKKNFDSNIFEDMKLTEDLTQEFALLKSKKLLRNPKLESIEREIEKFENIGFEIQEEDLMITRSKMYIKVNRNKDLRLFGNSVSFEIDKSDI